MKKVKLMSLLMLIMALVGCTENPTENNVNMEVSAKRVYCKEADIAISVYENLPVNVTAGVDGNYMNFTLNSPDTVITVKYLKSSTGYNIDVKVNNTTKSVSIITMAPTSHEFSWEYQEFEGLHGSSEFYDATIISNTSAWAVGRITTDGYGNNIYNAAYYNGTTWELKRLFAEIDPYKDLIDTYSVYQLNENSIWFGGLVTLEDGEKWTWDIRDGQFRAFVYSIWGTSRDNMYIVGSYGKMARYNGREWLKIETGLPEDITLSEIAGINESEFYILGTGLHNLRRKTWVYKYKSGEIEESQEFSLDKTERESVYNQISGLWLDEQGVLHCGGGYLYDNKEGDWELRDDFPSNDPNGYYNPDERAFVYDVDGNGSNDYFAVGEFSTCLHFNGETWQQVGRHFSRTDNRIVWQKVYQKGNLVVVVGRHNGNAAIMTLKR